MAVSSLSLRVNEVQLAPTKLQTKQHCREAQARRNWSCRCLTSPAAKSTMCQRCLTQPQCSVQCVWKGAGSDCPESTGHTVQHHSPSRQAHTESKGLSKHLQSCAQLCQIQAAHHSKQRGTQAGLQPLQETEQLSSQSSLPKGNWWGLTDRVLLSSAQMASGGTENQLVLPY